MPEVPKVNKSPKPTEKLPTDRLAFEKQTDLLRGWVAASGAAGKPVGNPEVAKIVKMAPATISLANPFFVANGFLEKSNGGYVAADSVRSFARFYEYTPETAGHKLADLLKDTWFGGAILPKLSFRALEKKEAIATLADECRATAQYENRLELLLEYLQFAGLIELDGNQVKGAKPAKAAEPSSRPAEKLPAEKPKTKSASITTGFVQPTEGQIQFHVDVKVDMAEFAGWSADRITAFFGGIAQVLAAKGKLEKGAANE